MTVNILTALRQLDVNNDNHWTADGAPRLETVRMLAKDATVSREALTLAAPGFSRAKGLPATPAGPSVQAAPPAPAPATDEVPETVPEDAEAVLSEHASAPSRSALSAKEQAMLKLARARTEHDAAASRLAEANAEMDTILAAEEKAVSKNDFSTTVRSYLDRQAELRERRAAQMDALRGVDLRSLVPTKSKIDQAFARRTERGLQRPKFG